MVYGDYIPVYIGYIPFGGGYITVIVVIFWFLVVISSEVISGPAIASKKELCSN